VLAARLQAHLGRRRALDPEGRAEARGQLGVERLLGLVGHRDRQLDPIARGDGHRELRVEGERALRGHRDRAGARAAVGAEALGGDPKRGDRVRGREAHGGLAAGVGHHRRVPVDRLAEIGARAVVTGGVERHREHPHRREAAVARAVVDPLAGDRLGLVVGAQPVPLELAVVIEADDPRRRRWSHGPAADRPRRSGGQGPAVRGARGGHRLGGWRGHGDRGLLRQDRRRRRRRAQGQEHRGGGAVADRDRGRGGQAAAVGGDRARAAGQPGDAEAAAAIEGDPTDDRAAGDRDAGAGQGRAAGVDDHALDRAGAGDGGERGRGQSGGGQERAMEEAGGHGVAPSAAVIGRHSKRR
jgi:hypothetical protein